MRALRSTTAVLAIACSSARVETPAPVAAEPRAAFRAYVDSVVAACAARLGRSGPTPGPRGARVVSAIALGQIVLGFLNVVMLAPVWLQLAHLLVADALWIGFVLLGAHALTERAVARSRAHAA